MLINHYNYTASTGGSARAAVRLIKAINNVDSSTVRAELHSYRTRVCLNSSNKTSLAVSDFIPLVFSRLDSLPLRLLGVSRDQECSLSLVPSSVHHRINNSKADIVHLHWIQGSYIPIGSIHRISKPLVWTLHDCWPFSGIHHYPQMWSFRMRRPLRDYIVEKLDSHVSTFKIKSFYNKKITFVAPSAWIAQLASEKLISPNHTIRTIPNALPVDIFCPSDKKCARKSLGLDINKPILLFVSASSSTNIRKGWDIMLNLLEINNTIDRNITLISVGAGGASSIVSRESYRPFGTVNNDSLLASIYSSSDLTVLPSRLDNLPQVATESLSCGTPVVAFRCGGLGDCVSHLSTGYLATPYLASEMLKGIELLLSDTDRLGSMSRRCREFAVKNWSPPLIASQHLNLYKSLSSY